MFVAIVTLADYLCHVSAVGNSGRRTPLEPDEAFWEIFRKGGRAEPIDIEELRGEFMLDYDQAETFIQLVRAGESRQETVDRRQEAGGIA